MQSDITYLLPIRSARVAPNAIADLAAYLRSVLPACAEIIVVDGSEPPVFDAQHSAWSPYCKHIHPDPIYRYMNGKSNGVFTGVDEAANDKIVVGDDDVRYTAENISHMSVLLNRYDYVKPQNYFDPVPLHSHVETARMLINRAVLKTGDFPGTCGFRRSVLLRIGPYDGNVLFDNEEMFRHFALNGAAICCAQNFFVRRLPPTLAKFLEQRPRQSYEDLVMRGKTALFASFLPGALILVSMRRKLAIGSYFSLWFLGAVLLAFMGRRRAGGATHFSILSCLFAAPWVVERGISVWIALFWRTVAGGLPYWGRIVPKGTGGAFVPGGREAARQVTHGA